MDYNYRRYIFGALALIFVINISYYFLSAPSNNTVSDRIETQYQNRIVAGAIQPLPEIIAIDKRWVALGKALFHSPLLSKDNTISCASCHIINQGGDDGFPVSTGIDGKLGLRNSPTVLNAALNFRQFWDGRNTTLSEQAIGPIHNPIEMGSNFNEIIVKLNKVPAFKNAFNELDADGITKENIILALATFEESLLTPNSAIDDYLLGDENALTEQQKRGLKKFNDYGCVTCHQGRNIGGNLFQRIGRIDQAPSHLLADKGRYQVTSDINDLHVYKVPSLRNITKTAPYFHNGEVQTLPEAIQIMAKTQLGIKLSQQDIDDIAALFEAFSGELEVIGVK